LIIIANVSVVRATLSTSYTRIDKAKVAEEKKSGKIIKNVQIIHLMP
jgi:hypothetical protein